MPHEIDSTCTSYYHTGRQATPDGPRSPRKRRGVLLTLAYKSKGRDIITPNPRSGYDVGQVRQPDHRNSQEDTLPHWSGTPMVAADHDGRPLPQPAHLLGYRRTELNLELPYLGTSQPYGYTYSTLTKQTILYSE